MHCLFTLRITCMTWRARAQSSCSTSQKSIHSTAHHYPKKISKFRIRNMVSTGCLLPSHMHTCSIASVVSDSLWPNNCSPQASLFKRFSRHEYWSGWHALLQGISPIWGFSTQLLHLLHYRQILYPLRHLRNPSNTFTPLKSEILN